MSTDAAAAAEFEGSRATACRYYNSNDGCRTGDKCRFPHTRLCYYYHTPGLHCFRREHCLFIHEHGADDLCACSVEKCSRLALRSKGGVCRTCLADPSLFGGGVGAFVATATATADKGGRGKKKKKRKKRHCETPSCDGRPAAHKAYCSACWQEVRDYLV
jgi:hypothetical protein